MVTEGLHLSGEIGVGGGKRGVRGDELLAFLLEAALVRLSRALSMESSRPGLRVVEWAELARPR